jgi:hypothetical protein
MEQSALIAYPPVFGEHETIRAVAKGRSLARGGDGEVKIALGHGYCREPQNAKLSEEVRNVLLNPNPGCLVGIPTMDPDGIRYWNWSRHQARYAAFFAAGKCRYYSAFIGRPECAQWIDNREYVDMVAALWRGKHVAVVCEFEGSMLNAVAYGSAKITHIECPFREAYSVIDQLEQAVVDCKPDIAILAAGPTATCLANRLHARGVQAVDLGSGGKFYCRWLSQ